MRMTGESSGRTVRPASSWRSQKLFYLAVFAVAGVAIYRWGLAAADRAESSRSYTSTATIRLRDGAQAEAEPEQIQRQIASVSNVHQALSRLAPPGASPSTDDPQATAGRAVEPVRQRLRVTAERTSVPGELAISISYTDRVAGYAARLVNRLAEAYAEGYRAAWKGRAHGAYVEAREASERAEEELTEAKARLDAFCQRHFGSPQARRPADAVDPGEPGADSGQTGPTGPWEPDGPVLPGEAPAGPESLVDSTPVEKRPVNSQPIDNKKNVDNPEWLGLSERLETLKQHREQLLVDRTPLHPEVRDTELRIAALEEQLSVTPSKIPAESAGPSTTANQPPAEDAPTPPAEMPPGQTVAERSETARRYRTFKEAADQAAEAYSQAVRLEREAWQEYLQGPRIELDLARPAPAAPAARPTLSLVLAALAAGLAVTVGVGMISAGTAIEPPLTTLKQVQDLLPVPIVGIIPETGPSSGREPLPRWRPLLRPTLILAGLVLITGCMGLLLQAWVGR